MSATRKVDHARLLSVYAITPSPENTLLYKPVTPDDPATIELADSIREHDILEPLVVSADRYIISGHRRHCAGRLAGLEEVPCRVLDIRRGDGEKASDEFLKLLREHNRHRIKSHNELLREAIISADHDPGKAHRALTAYRKRKSKIKVATIQIRETQRRKEISSAKKAFLAAVKRIIFALEEFWPLTLRQIHYQLLNDPPLVHAAKPDSRYGNDMNSYRALIDLVTRARHEGYIDYDVIDDPTRPVTIWNVHANLASYYEQQMKDLLNDYWRDLMQSQPNHIEIVIEKLTLQNVFRPVAEKFCILSGIGRGQNTTRPMYDISERYKASGKEKLIILAVNDLDPDGDAIAHALGQRLRDDFNIHKIEVIKCALTMEQVRKLKLPESSERVKEKSPNRQRYIDTYHTDFVWELEAVPPKVLQKLLTNVIDGVIDRKAFNAEVAQERADAAHLAAVREIVLRTLQAQITESRA